jgi:flagellar protein FliS
MNAFADPHRAFGSDSLATLSGPRVVVMCFDRLDRDLAAAAEAIGSRDLFKANTALQHAQDLVTELLVMLDVEAWEHAPTLASVYDYLVRLLAAANTTKRMSKVEEAQRLVAELGDAFREAAAPKTAPATTSASTTTGYAGGFSARA